MPQPPRTYDINGDGYHDLLLSEPDGGASNGGRAMVYYGSASGIASVTVGAGATGAASVFQGPTNALMGNALAVGDINGDGYADAVVAAYRYPNVTDQGAVYIFYSQGASGIAGQDLQAGGSAGATLLGESAGDSFGRSIYVGDYNGDGFADVAVLATGYGSFGRIYVFLSDGSSGIQSQSAAGADVIVSGGTNTRLQITINALVLADVNGDGREDLAACAIDVPNSLFTLAVIHSDSRTTIDLGAGDSPNTSISAAFLAGAFCIRGLAAGDANGDGYADILGSAYDYDAGSGGNQGQVYLFLSGGPAGITATSPSQANTILSGSGTIRFGILSGMADINGDGFDDLLIGERTAPTPQHLYIFHGSSSGVAGKNLFTGDFADTQLDDGPDGLTDWLGAGDYNGDGYFDLVTSNTQNSEDLWIFQGSSSGIANGTPSAADTVLSDVNVGGGGAIYFPP